MLSEIYIHNIFALTDNFTPWSQPPQTPVYLAIFLHPPTLHHLTIVTCAEDMLSAFKIKSFDLQPVLEEWKDAPVFYGNPHKDPPVEEWLDKIKEGCVQRGVPEEYWYKVAQHNMGPKAKAR